jgi:hypothetical protein
VDAIHASFRCKHKFEQGSSIKSVIITLRSVVAVARGEEEDQEFNSLYSLYVFTKPHMIEVQAAPHLPRLGLQLQPPFVFQDLASIDDAYVFHSCHQQVLDTCSCVMGQMDKPNHEQSDDLGSSLDLAQRRNRNARALVCRLPPELLTDIFHYCQWMLCPPQPPVPPYMKFTPSWVRLMLVCQYFRDVAIHAPILWSNLIFRSPRSPVEYTNLCLERSQNALLRIDSSHMKHVHRAGTINLTGIIPARTEDMRRLKEAGLPLRSLKCTCMPGSTRVTFPVTSSLFADQSINLVRMDLGGSAIELLSDAPLLPSLRNLTLSAVTTSPDLEPLARLLTNAPAVEKLHLSNFEFLDFEMPNHPDWFMPAPSRISLPSLKSLRVEEQTPVVSALIRLLPLPSMALALTVWQHSEDHLYLTDSHHQIYQACLNFTHASGLAIGKGRMKFCGENGPDYTGQTEFGSIIDFGQPGGSMFYLRMDCLPEDEHPLLDAIETLHLGQYDDLEDIVDVDEDFRACYMPNLKAIFVDFIPATTTYAWWLKEWLVRRGNRVQDIKFDCFMDNDDMMGWADALRNEGLSPSITRDSLD